VWGPPERRSTPHRAAPRRRLAASRQAAEAAQAINGTERDRSSLSPSLQEIEARVDRLAYPSASYFFTKCPAFAVD